eukprot:CAMPEP_0175046718 /NCGR_PEP_ID=MMETSP0052_2-20121109/5186_1 /TAXON_ID=51329 ORGANISM="Polytomella parva, Strain SAG 63-3" /NCGR_SAMPLE_ID=MMETSP0052_2 /ASSEMBLY_ACC=CAM_ASM_000194 /LENGTH=311 /DNA_ID=CAMNT_0016310495 /DNA_START=427 /DNA_END=1358 /DNA_ORIENTATION=+
MYHFASHNCLTWGSRLNSLTTLIREARPTILCLQEVEIWEDVKKRLFPLGYDGIFLKRTGDRQDGCATLWQSDAFECAWIKEMYMDRRDLRDNVALLVELKRRPLSYLSDTFDEIFTTTAATILPSVLVANTHVLFNPKRGQIKLGQLQAILAAIDHRLQERERSPDDDGGVESGYNDSSSYEDENGDVVHPNGLRLGSANRRQRRNSRNGTCDTFDDFNSSHLPGHVPSILPPCTVIFGGDLNLEPFSVLYRLLESRPSVVFPPNLSELSISGQSFGLEIAGLKKASKAFFKKFGDLDGECGGGGGGGGG